MIKTYAVTNDAKLIVDLPLIRLSDSTIKWYWVDLDSPTEEEVKVLSTHFKFHPLAIDDCLHFLQRPKVDYYDEYNFYVIHSLHPTTLAPEELDVFVGSNYIVTFHLSPLKEIEEAMKKMQDRKYLEEGFMYLFYEILDNVVDEYFPIIYKIEDVLNEIEMSKTNEELIQDVYKYRNDLIKLRRTIFPMRDLLYRILNSERIRIHKKDKVYFTNVSSHLIRLTEMVDSNREMTADIRDNYISINSHRMNSIMKTLTVMSSIFIPLTFIASIYGMNFEHMPDLRWRGGYFGVLGVMVLTGCGMLFGLKIKGWFK